MSVTEETAAPAAREAQPRMAAPRYPWLRRMLHWAVAILVILLIPAGLIMDRADRAAFDGALWQGSFNLLYDLHKSAGLTVLGLMVLRVVAKSASPNPDYDPPIRGWERKAAHAVHGAMYVLLFLVPVVGWLGVSLFPAPAPFWFLVDLRLPIGQWRDASGFLIGWLHAPLAILLGILASVHVLAALKHRLIGRDGVWERMAPPKR